MRQPASIAAPITSARRRRANRARAKPRAKAADASPLTKEQLRWQVPVRSSTGVNWSGPPNSTMCIGRGRAQWSFSTTLARRPGPSASTAARKIHCGRPSPNRCRRVASAKTMPAAAARLAAQVTSVNRVRSSSAMSEPLSQNWRGPRLSSRLTPRSRLGQPTKMIAASTPAMAAAAARPSLARASVAALASRPRSIIAIMASGPPRDRSSPRARARPEAAFAPRPRSRCRSGG